LVSNLFYQDEAFCSEADLTCITEAPLDPGCDRLRNVRIFTDDKSIRAAQLHDCFLDHFSGLGGDGRTSPDASRNRSSLDTRIIDDVEEAPARIRGTITAIDDGSITVKERDGRSFRLKTGPYTTYADVVPSSLDAIKVNDFIGTASKGPLNHWIAVEIVIIPESMRTGRKGYAAWDPLPDTSGVHTSGTTATSMTNGLVSSVSPATPKLTNTSMTNGTVVASNSGAVGRTLTVTYDGNKTSRIIVPSTAPIVRFVPSDRSAISVGSTIFVKTNPGSQAALIAVGKGVTPPM
jgi:hypothetical protein